jgi:hypothetical protein
LHYKISGSLIHINEAPSEEGPIVNPHMRQTTERGQIRNEKSDNLTNPAKQKQYAVTATRLET